MNSSAQALLKHILRPANPWLGAGFAVSLSALLQWFSFPSQASPWLAWLAMTPLFAILHWRSPWLSFVAWGGSQALTFALGGLWTRHFMTESIGMEEWQALLVVAACCLWSGIPHACFGWLATRYRLGESVLGTLGAVALLALLGTLFPYPFPCDQSLTQYREPIIIQIVELGGRELLYFSILAVNGLVFLAIRRAYLRDAAAWAPLLACLTIVAVVLSFGAVRLHSLKTAPVEPIAIGIVQAAVPPKNISKERNAFPSNYRPGVLRMRPMTIDLAAQRDLDLVIWPEIPSVISYLSKAQDRAQVDAVVRETGIPLLFCTFEPDAETHPDHETPAGFEGRQVSYLIEPGDGPAKTATKQNLVPFGETLPFENNLPWLRSMFPDVGRMRTEGNQLPLELGDHGIRIAPLICYDDMFTHTSRNFADSGANILVTQANDSWFGNNSSLDWRLATGIFRSVETRLPWVRVGNSGYTLSADRSGQIHWNNQLPVFTRAIGVYEISPGDPTVSFYPHTIWPTRFGLAVLALWPIIKAHLKRRTAAPPGNI